MPYIASPMPFLANSYITKEANNQNYTVKNYQPIGYHT